MLAKRWLTTVMLHRNVFIACLPGVEVLDIAGLASVFSRATVLLGGGAGYDVRLAALKAGAVVTASGITVRARHALEAIRDPVDTLVVAGGLPEAVVSASALAPVVRRVAPRARRVASVCTGSSVLSEAGLLDGRAAVTHWAACDELRRRNPRCRVEDDRLYVRDGHIWTSAGGSSGIDLALAMVEEDHGARLALDVARWLVVYLRRSGGQSQLSAPLAAQITEHRGLRELLLWMSENIHRDLPVAALARRANMSARTFARVFVAETKFTPAAFLETLRIDAARRSLETTSKTVKQIARQCGFGTVKAMHRAFKHVVRATPLQYRARSASKSSR